MRNKFHYFTFLLLGFLLSFSIASAKEKFGEEAEALVKGAQWVQTDERFGTISFIQLRSDFIVEETQHFNWLASEALGLSNDYDFKLTSIENDELSHTHYRYKMYYKDIPIEPGTFYVHVFNGRVTSANGEYALFQDIENNPNISREDAFQTAIDQAQINAVDPARAAEIELMKSNGALVFLQTGEHKKLAWKFELNEEIPLVKNANYYIDAMTSEILYVDDLIMHIDFPTTAPSMYSGNVPIICNKTLSNIYTLNETSRGLGINTYSYYYTYYGSYSTNTISSPDTLWRLNSNLRYGVDVHYALESSYDFFFQKFNRNSYDNSGHALNSYINYYGYTAATYSGANFYFPMINGNNLAQATIEIVGHEYAHAVISKTAALTGGAEARALNEGFSDIFGVAIDFFKNPTTANFIIGERTKANGVPSRNMGYPNLVGFPSSYLGTNYLASNYYNAGAVLNYWFYLLVNGGSGTNDFGNNYQINSIGLDAASRIAYYALTTFLTNSSNYSSCRTATIAAVTNLYGACSKEAKEVTKAWYAVNVGANYSAGISAGALLSQTSLCNGTAINCLNLSVNAASYLWDFGDGDTSTLVSPSHVYALPGNYTIRLIASGSNGCNTEDTVFFTNIIVQSLTSLFPSACQPSKLNIGGAAGIYQVLFGNINKLSGSATTEGNQDFTCEAYTNINPGDNLQLKVNTSGTTPEFVDAWIDYNNDGIFSISELVYQSPSELMYHNGIVFTITNPVLNTPLRMRIIDDYSQPISGPCATLNNGQSEDYTITFVPSTSPPIVDFTTTDTIISQGDTIQFVDLTVNSDTRIWSFPGGTPSTSTLENPFITYNVPGVYPVTLVETNAFGMDSLTKTSYIYVTKIYNACGPFNTSTETYGTLYDSGGPNGSVTGTQFCEFEIDPGCATSITITFPSIQIGAQDVITILNRGSFAPAWGNAVAVFSGVSNNVSATVTGGKMLIRFQKNSTGTFDGFKATWTTDQFISQPPIASFIPDNISPPFRSPVRFENQSQGEDLDFAWDFGDGVTSGTSNSIHEYDSAGIYTVTLIASNCVGSDTTSMLITVQEPPIMLVTSDTIDVSISCGDSIVVPVMVYNNGLGDLLISENGYTNMDDTIHILAYSAYENFSLSYYGILLNHLNLNFPKYTLTKFTSSDTNLIKQSLENKQVLLFPLGHNDPDTAYSNFEYLVNAFMQRGGNAVVFGGTNPAGDNRLRAMNILNAKPLTAYNFTNISVLDTTDFLTENLSSTFPPASYLGFPVSVLNKHKKTLITNNGDEVLVYRNYGKGKGIYNGLNTNTNNITVGRTIVNCIKSAQNRWPDWLLASPESDIIHPGDSSIAYFTIKPFKLTPGIHNAYIRINGNDSSNLSHEFVLRLNILSSPLLTFQDTCLDFGLVTVGDSLTKNIIIQNPGCDTLIITSISSTQPDFTVYADSFLLPIATSASVNVNFKPQSYGVFSDTLFFHTNIGIIPHCIAGIGTIEPIIYFPDSIIYLSHDVCGGSDSVGFWLHNTGGNYLHYSLTGGTVDLPRRILMNVSGVDLQHEYLNTINSIQQNFANVIIDTTSLVNSNTFFPLLKNKDVVLFPRQETGASYISAVSNSIRNFVSSGGNAIILGMNFHTNIGSNPIIYSSGLFSGSDTADVSSGNSTVMDTTDWFVKNVNPIFTNPTTTYLQKITDLNKKLIVSSYGKDVVTFKKYGNGNATYIGYDYNLITSDIQKILANAIEFAYRDNFTIGFSASPDSGTIAPGDSVFIMVKSAIDGFAAGNYSMPIAILGNDPLVQNDTIVVQVQLGSNPCADFNAIATTTCDGTISFTQNLLNPGTTWKWYFGDGDSSSVQDPVHTYLTNGTKTVTLISTNSFGTDTITKTISITRYIPTTTITGTPIVGSNLTFNANLNTGQFNRLWDFGDGSATSTASVPTHAYSLPGTYIITVLFTNAICTIPHTDTIVILPVGISELIAEGSFDIRPNPSVQEAEIRFELIKTGNVSLEIIDVTGRCIERFCENERKIAGKYVYKFNANSSGIYSVLLRVNDELMTLKLVKTE